MKKCPQGQYYCNDSKKCKPIPGGYHTTRLGYLVRDNDDDSKKKNGNGNGSHNGNGNGNGNGHSGNGNGGNGNGSSGGNGGGVSESTYIPRKTGNIVTAMLAWRGSQYSLQMFFPHIKTPSRREVQDQVRKVYPNAKLWNYKVSDYDPGEPLLQIGGRKN
tara:strand:- start:86 stop:565 length:480 start_codon:yes stop_codon:yes gene_type:complete